MRDLSDRERQAIEEQVDVVTAVEPVEIPTERDRHTFSLLVCQTPRGKVVVVRGERCQCYGSAADDEAHADHNIHCFREMIDQIEPSHFCSRFLSGQPRETDSRETKRKRRILALRGIEIIALPR